MSDSPKVVLKPHTGLQKRRGKKVLATLPQQKVFLDDQLVGYVSNKPGTRFRPITRQITDEEREQILAAIGKFHGSAEAAQSSIAPPSDDPVDAPADEDVTPAEEDLDELDT